MTVIMKGTTAQPATAVDRPLVRQLENAPEACSYARHWAHEVTGVWRCPVDQAERVQHVLSELVGNALLHARTPRRAKLENLAGGAIRVAVDDGGPASRPVRADAQDYGRGLVIVGQLATVSGRTEVWGAGLFRSQSWAVVTP